jgi:ribonuclease HI
MSQEKSKKKKNIHESGKNLSKVPSLSLTNAKLNLTSDYEPDSSLRTIGGFRVNSTGFTVVYTDGSCLANGTEKAKASMGIYFAKDSPYNVSQQLPSRYKHSNNAAEIVASKEAFRLCKQNKLSLIELRTDSKFLLGCVLEHMPTWKYNGWMKTNGKPVTNRAELEELDQVLKGLTVKWVYVPGHSNETGNDCADFLARWATFKMMREIDPLYIQP